jgi:hypothetical protein
MNINIYLFSLIPSVKVFVIPQLAFKVVPKVYSQKPYLYFLQLGKLIRKLEKLLNKND